MRVLLIKTSSMGDLIHTLPALTDAGNAIPGIQFDWIAEESFAEIPAWHPLVRRVIPVALRRWRKGVFSKETREGWRELRAALHEQYDLVLDAQGLMKSAFLTFFAKGTRAGLDFRSAREGFAALAYQKKCTLIFISMLLCACAFVRAGIKLRFARYAAGFWFGPQAFTPPLEAALMWCFCMYHLGQ